MAAKTRRKAKAKSKQVGKSAKPTGLDVALDCLKKNPSASFAEIAKVGAAKGVKVWGANFGRAQALLGIVKAKPRGQGKAASRKKAKAVAASGTAVRRGPGRPRKSASEHMATIEGIVDAVRDNERERMRYRAALQKLQHIVVETIG